MTERSVGKADEDDKIAEVAMVTVVGLGCGNAVLFGYLPSLAAFQPLLSGDGEAGLIAQGGRVDGADRILRRHEAAIGGRHGIDPVARLVLDNCVVVSIVIAVIAFVASGKKEQSVAVGLELHHGHVLHVDCLGLVAAHKKGD